MVSIVRGYHGTTLPDAELIEKQRRIDGRIQPYHWLGQGIYFWEDAPVRAWAWALDRSKRSGHPPAVISALVVLRDCLDLLDIDGWRFVRKAYGLLERLDALGVEQLLQQQPSFYVDARNKSQKHYLGTRINPPPSLRQGFNYLDCNVIEHAVLLAEGITGKRVGSVRGAFLEGQQLYDNSYFIDRSHVQIAVRDPGMISDLMIEPEADLRKRFGTP